MASICDQADAGVRPGILAPGPALHPARWLIIHQIIQQIVRITDPGVPFDGELLPKRRRSGDGRGQVKQRLIRGCINRAIESERPRQL